QQRPPLPRVPRPAPAGRRALLRRGPDAAVELVEQPPGGVGLGGVGGGEAADAGGDAQGQRHPGLQLQPRAGAAGDGAREQPPPPGAAPTPPPRPRGPPPPPRPAPPPPPPPAPRPRHPPPVAQQQVLGVFVVVPLHRVDRVGVGAEVVPAPDEARDRRRHL